MSPWNIVLSFRDLIKGCSQGWCFSSGLAFWICWRTMHVWPCTPRWKPTTPGRPGPNLGLNLSSTSAVAPKPQLHFWCIRRLNCGYRMPKVAWFDQETIGRLWKVELEQLSNSMGWILTHSMRCEQCQTQREARSVVEPRACCRCSMNWRSSDPHSSFSWNFWYRFMIHIKLYIIIIHHIMCPICFWLPDI